MLIKEQNDFQIQSIGRIELETAVSNACLVKKEFNKRSNSLIPFNDFCIAHKKQLYNLTVKVEILSTRHL